MDFCRFYRFLIILMFFIGSTFGLFERLSAGLCAMWKQNCVAKVSKLWFHVKNVTANLYIIETYRSTKYVHMAKYLGTDHEAKNKISHLMHNIRNNLYKLWRKLLIFICKFEC